MNQHDPSLLHVCEQAWGEVRPRAAFLHVTLTGCRLFSGRAALAKSEELRALVEALGARGLRDDAIALDGVTIDVSTGLFSRSSSATYRVRVHVTDLDLLAPAFDAIAAAKQATLTHVTWDYTGGGSDELVAESAARAASKARLLAASLGVALGAVHEVHAEDLADVMPVQTRLAAMDAEMVVARKRQSVASELAGIDLAPTKQVGVRVRVAFRLSPDSRPAP